MKVSYKSDLCCQHLGMLVVYSELEMFFNLNSYRFNRIYICVDKRYLLGTYSLIISLQPNYGLFNIKQTVKFIDFNSNRKHGNCVSDTYKLLHPLSNSAILILYT